MFEEMVLVQYRDFAKVFSEEESQHLPEHQPWDHTIDLEEGAVQHWKIKSYPMSPNKHEELDKFLKEHVSKGYLVPSKSPWHCQSSLLRRRMVNLGSCRIIEDLTK